MQWTSARRGAEPQPWIRRPNAFLGMVILTVALSATRLAPADERIGPLEPYADAVRALDRWIDAEREAKGIPAVSIALVDDQRIVWARGFGFADPARKTPATAETVYRVGSVSKLFTDLAAMQLVEQGKLDLDAPVSRALNEFAPRNPFGKPTTVRQLMTHQAGLVREPPVGHYFDPTGPSLASTVQSLNATALVYPPETQTKYSNAGVAVVGALVERLREEAFPQSVRRSVLEPLGMTRSSFEPDAALSRDLAQGVMWSYDGQKIPTPTFLLGTGPAGNLVSTVHDLARFLSAVFAGGRGPGGPVVRPETVRAMLNPQFASATNPGRFGLGFALSELDGHRRAGHGGAVYGFATEVSALPDEKLGVVVIATKDCANGFTLRVGDAALRLMLAAREGKLLPSLDRSEPIPPELARALEGRYANGSNSLDVLSRGGRVFLSTSEGGSWLELRRTREGLIVDDPISYGMEVRREGDRRIVFGREAYDRIEVPKPSAAPARWEGLIGEYGWDHDVLYILEKEGRLHALIEWFFDYPLEEIGPDTFRFPTSGLYDHETLVFQRGADGRATEVRAAEVVFRRRAIGSDGGTTFRIKPLRPVSELRVEARAAQPPREAGEFRAPDLVSLTSLDPSIHLDVRYASTNNFLGTPLYDSAQAFLQRPAAKALVRAHRKLEPLGYGLLIHDGYRPWAVTKMFWEATPEASRMFVANPAEGSKHNRGAAVDLSLFDRRTGRPVEMVGTYDEFSPRSNPDYPGGTTLQRRHRTLLRRAMEDEGFTVNDVEWWHFDYRDWPRYAIQNIPFESIPAGSSGPSPER